MFLFHLIHYRYNRAPVLGIPRASWFQHSLLTLLRQIKIYWLLTVTPAVYPRFVEFLQPWNKRFFSPNAAFLFLDTIYLMTEARNARPFLEYYVLGRLNIPSWPYSSKVSGDRVVNALQAQWGVLVLHRRTYPFRQSRVLKEEKEEKKTTFFVALLFSACIASDIEMSCSILNFTWSTGPSFSTARCHSELWTGVHLTHKCGDVIHPPRPCRWTKAARRRKEGWLWRCRANENETVCLSRVSLPSRCLHMAEVCSLLEFSSLLNH